MSDKLHYMELRDVAAAMHAGKVSPVELADAMLARIADVDPSLHSYAVVMGEQAKADAAAAEKRIAAGNAIGPLDGVPVAVKDLCWTKGTASAHGTMIHREFVPDEDATVVRRLREAGAVILGKLEQTEGAFADHHPDVDTPLNPWGEELWIGSSSSGSGAATAAGLCFGSIGTDTGGSIRFPSNANGVTGIKPTWGRVSRFNVFELAATLDHVGPMARSAADAAAMLGVLAGDDPRDPTSSTLEVPDYAAASAGWQSILPRLRLAADPRWNTANVDEPTVKAFEHMKEVFRNLGVDVVEAQFPDSAQIVQDWASYCAVETAVAHEATYPSRASEYGPGLASLIDLGRSQSAMDYQKMILRRNDFAGRVHRLFKEIDLLLVPVTPVAGPTNALMAEFGEKPELLTDMLRFTCPFDMSRNPTITLPCGFTDRGTPIGFQIVARSFDEASLCAAGSAFQSVTDWHKRHPPKFN